MNGIWQTLVEFRDLFTERPIFLVGLLLLVGYGIGKLAVRARFPEITGFILAGLFVSSFTTGIVSEEMNESLHVVTEVAIGFLALTIGGEFSARKLRRIGRDIVLITVVHLIGTFAVVFGACLAMDWLFPELHVGHPYVILLAVIACATSPTIIVAEVHHMRAHGRFIDYLFGVVALGDAIAVVVFGIAFTLVTNILGAAESNPLILRSFLEIIGSVAIGALGAVPLAIVARKVHNPNELMIITTGIIFSLTGVSLALHLSPLLVNMAMGAVLINISPRNDRVFGSIEPFTPPIYALFFVIAGLEIDPSVFLNRITLLVGTFYIVVRGVGKIWSTSLGCRLCRLPPAIGRHIGMCMLSKGGIALGFVLLIQTSPAVETLRSNPQIYSILAHLVNVILFSIFVNELISPFFLRYAVVRGNEMEDA
jgi:Kef-type K+ transport system membrane component KefB